MSGVICLNEKINKMNAHFILDNYKFEEYFIGFDGSKKDAQKQYKIIMNYLNKKVSIDNDWVKYDFVKGRKDGRLYGIETCQNTNRDIRSFICEGITTDIDVKNAHPTILLKLCDKYEIIAPNLALYINDRKKCLDEIIQYDSCNADQAKKKVLTSTNMDKAIKTKSEFLKSYDKEMKIIQKKFQEIDDFNYIKNYAKRDNFDGSFINHILCINENIILMSMKSYCEISEIKVHSLIFDGLQVYGDVNENFIKKMEQHIHNTTEFNNIFLAIKPHEHDFIIPDGYKPTNRITYEDVKKEFELINCKVRHQFVSSMDESAWIYNIGDFKTLHMEMKYTTEDGIIVDFIDTWLKDENKIKYNRFDCIPKDSLCPKDTFNLWVKFPVEKMPTVKPNGKVILGLQWFLNHIRLMVNFNEEHYQFVMKWLAQMFQYPEHKSTHLIFIGEEGCGKGTFVKFLYTMMGGGHRCWSCADPQEDIFGKFNDMMKDAFLVIMNEADKSGTFNSNNKLKDLITEPDINIRPKGKTAFRMKSCHRFMTFSNNPDPSIKNKRRDFTMLMSSNRVGDENYFTDGNKYANDIEVCKVIYDYLMNWECNPVITIRDIPEGEYDKLLIEEQKDPIVLFIEELVYINIRLEEPIAFTSINLYEIFIDFCNRNHIPYVKNKVAFGMAISFKNYNGIRKLVKKIDKKAQNVWEFDFQVLKNEPRLKILEFSDDDDDDGE